MLLILAGGRSRRDRRSGGRATRLLRTLFAEMGLVALGEGSTQMAVALG